MNGKGQEVYYEFTIVLYLDLKHCVSSSKDRTGLFIDKPQFTIKEEAGKEGQGLVYDRE